MIALRNSTMIRPILYGNAMFSGMAGLLFIFASRPITRFIGIDLPLAILTLGLGLIGYAALIYINASHPDISRSFVLFTVVCDSTWVLLSIILLLTDWVPFSVAGKWAVGITAVMVDIFATLQFFEWRKL